MMTHEDIVFEMAKLVVYEYVKDKITSPRFKHKDKKSLTLSVENIKERTYMRAWKNGVSRKDVKLVLDDKSYIVQLAEVIQKNLITTCKMELVPDCEMRVSYSEIKRMTLPFIIFDDILNGQSWSEDIITSMVRRINDRIERIKKVYRCNYVVEDRKAYNFEDVKYD